MTKIFISYRRADSQHITDRIYDHMILHFGEGNVFQDVDAIPPGVDFRQYLEDAVNNCDAVLVVIGPEWTRILQERASQANDFVRIEVEKALQLDKLVVPVTVRGASMPAPHDLPESVSDLCWRNAVNVRPNPDFKRDCQYLADGIKGFFTTSTPSPTIDSPLPRSGLGEGAGVRANANAEAVRAIIGDPFDWCDVPAGEFLYGEDNEKRTLPTFAIAKYPITYSQFQVFVDAKDGFYDDRWWDGLAADAGHRKQPGDQEWKIADHPRLRASWYDVTAFCRWLSFRLGGGYAVDKIEDWFIRLPTEFEWEKAARGTNGLVYPYGNEFDKTKCNTKESGIGQTTPVTQYPQGASPYGVMDMSGNVWEWCLTDKYEPVQDATKENLGLKSSRVLRGGAWITDSNHSLAVYRGSDLPHGRGNYLGSVGIRLVYP